MPRCLLESATCARGLLLPRQFVHLAPRQASHRAASRVPTPLSLQLPAPPFAFCVKQRGWSATRGSCGCSTSTPRGMPCWQTPPSPSRPAPTVSSLCVWVGGQAGARRQGDLALLAGLPLGGEQPWPPGRRAGKRAGCRAPFPLPAAAGIPRSPQPPPAHPWPRPAPRPAPQTAARRRAAPCTPSWPTPSASCLIPTCLRCAPTPTATWWRPNACCGAVRWRVV